MYMRGSKVNARWIWVATLVAVCSAFCYAQPGPGPANGAGQTTPAEQVASESLQPRVSPHVLAAQRRAAVASDLAQQGNRTGPSWVRHDHASLNQAGTH